MKLSQIISKTDISLLSNQDIEIDNITFDSRECSTNSLFVAIKGETSDGHDYIAKAIELGATAIIYELNHYTPSDTYNNIVFLGSRQVRKTLALMASNFYSNPSEDFNLIGVTGTNGKTTIATLLYNLYSDLGYKCGLISTIANYIGPNKYEATHTTPDPVHLNSLLSQMRDYGCEYCFMEVSSHSLAQERVTGLRFKGAIFTNLTHDHLDYHHTFMEYLKCKKLLFDNLSKDAFALTNIDDKNGNTMVQNTSAKIYSYSTRNSADFMVNILEKSIEGSLLKIDRQEVWSQFIGTHNAHNLAAVYGVATILGVEKMEALTAISNLKTVAGRLEYINGGENLTAVVDYAHTPDALENVLKTLKDISAANELITVFGCGGNRDKAKRPEMAKIAAKYSNRIIITSDNPRFEKAEDIMDDINSGLSPIDRKIALNIVDRKEAIKTAILTAKPNSIILIAGKGHENYQIINGVKSHFDDKEIINECFNLIN